MDYSKDSKKRQKGKALPLGKDEKRLELALTIKHLKQFKDWEIADVFDTDRQLIDYHYRKFSKKIRGERK